MQDLNMEIEKKGLENVKRRFQRYQVLLKKAGRKAGNVKD